MSFTFELKRTYQVDVIDAALRSGIDGATEAASRIGITEKQDVIDYWKSQSIEVIDKIEGRFILPRHNNVKCGYGWGASEGDTFFAHGGFYTNVNGSRTYAFTLGWWHPFCEMFANEGYSAVKLGILKNSAIERCCEHIAAKISYTSRFEDYDDESADYRKFIIDL